MAVDRPEQGLLRRLVQRLPLVLAVGAIIFGWVWLNREGIYFRDAIAYWRPDLDDLYGGGRVGTLSTYLYSPAFAQLVWPLGKLPWPVFAALWSGLSLVALVWMVGPYFGAVLFLFPGSPVGSEISTGNIHLLMAAAIVIGFRQPSILAFTVLTKVTPGVAILWFAGALRWRCLLVALATTIVITVVSFVTLPAAWFEWVETLRRSADVPITGSDAVVPGPLWLRFGLAALIAMAGGALGLRWIAPVSAVIALPVPWFSGLSLLVGSLALTRESWHRLSRQVWRDLPKCRR